MTTLAIKSVLDKALYVRMLYSSVQFQVTVRLLEIARELTNITHHRVFANRSLDVSKVPRIVCPC